MKRKKLLTKIPIRLPAIPRAKIHSSPKGKRGYTRQENRRMERAQRKGE